MGLENIPGEYAQVVEGPVDKQNIAEPNDQRDNH